MPHFLGLDSSTQSLSAMILDTDSNEIIWDHTINYGSDLAEFNSPNGFLHNDDPLVKCSDPLMWLAAIDRLFEAAKTASIDLSLIEGICGSGQQHGSVYLNEAFFEGISLDGPETLAEQMRPCVSRHEAPIWMDSSTSVECQEISTAAGGDERLVEISGSRAIERFTGPQIRKFYKNNAKAYDDTRRIHLVSSFICSIMSGTDASIDFGDGAGMNLLDIAEGQWSDTLVEATAPDLKEKLPTVVNSGSLVSTVSTYFVENYGFNSHCEVYTFSGDNPCSLVGMGASTPGTAVISMGTSDTFFAAMSRPVTDPQGYGHVFGNPAGGFMSLIAFKNGSLAREKVLEKFDLSWAQFETAILSDTAAGNSGNMMLPFYEPEITPNTQTARVELHGDAAFTNWENASATVRAIVEAQALNIKIHSAWIGETPTTIRVTGGASQNDGILQIFADVFQAELQRLAIGNSAALGAALMAANANGAAWTELIAQFSKTDPATIKPNPTNKELYQEMEKRFKQFISEGS